MRDGMDIVRKLQEDVVIPAYVQVKADAALASIINPPDDTISQKPKLITVSKVFLHVMLACKWR